MKTAYQYRPLSSTVYEGCLSSPYSANRIPYLPMSFLRAPASFSPHRRQRQLDRLFGLLHGYSQAVLPSIGNILPLQLPDIAYPQSAEAREQVSALYRFILHRSGNQCPHSPMVMYGRLLSGRQILSELLIFVNGFAFITSVCMAAFKAPFRMQ